MKIDEWLTTTTKKLKTSGVPSAHLDSLILLEDLLHIDRAYLLAKPDLSLTREQLNKLNRQIVRRAQHEPLAYIRGFTQFYGRRFKINKRVLEPRPESETMIELFKNLSLSKPVVADVGTGSGALGITIKLEAADSEVDLYDIDSACLAVARHNAHMHELHLHAYKRDLLNHPIRPYDVILANLPYVPKTWKINDAAAMEPKIAIFGGKDGLNLYRRMFTQASKLKIPPRFILTESLPPQHEELINIAKASSYKKIARQDFIVVFERF